MSRSKGGIININPHLTVSNPFTGPLNLDFLPKTGINRELKKLHSEVGEVDTVLRVKALRTGVRTDVELTTLTLT